MKKIDLHIHTVKTIHDDAFVFSLEKLKDYIKTIGIDGIAITNHNCFDLNQFNTISENLDITVFPGIEINLESGHLLLISSEDNLTDFDAKCKILTSEITSIDKSILVEKLIDIFGDLSNYLLIPHYMKKPSLNSSTIEKLKDYIKAGEVSSYKKFIHCYKDSDSLVPVLFSDCRISEELSRFPTRQTYIDLQKITIQGLKGCFADKTNVALSKENGNNFFNALDNGLKLSTGLNVMLGERSTGKTYTLNSIDKSFERVKYIKQFSLLERNEEKDNKKFEEKISNKKNRTTEEFLSNFKNVVDDISNIDIYSNGLLLEKYVTSLLKSASEHEKADTFSKALLFNETLFSLKENRTLKELINSIQMIIENTEYQEIIQKHVDIISIKKLAIELMEKYISLEIINSKRKYLNDLVSNIKRSLQYKTSATVIEDVDFYEILKDKIKVEKYKNIVNDIKIDREIKKENVRGFNIVALTKKYTGAQDLKNRCGHNLGFANAFNNYNDPYLYLQELKKIEGLPETDYYKYFVNTEYKILNKYGYEVSGGERSEFNLLEAISDALQYDMLLIDEPESSFDNLFLMKDVNKLIKEISKSIPVVVATHNNTVGASISPNYLVYTKKDVHVNDNQNWPQI